MPLGLKYQAKQQGPVPMMLYRNRKHLRATAFEFENLRENIFIVKSLQVPILDYFSEAEIKLMTDLVNGLAGVDAAGFSELSHALIRPWQKALDERGLSSNIDPADTFTGLKEKRENDLSAAEEHFLISEALNRAGHD